MVMILSMVASAFSVFVGVLVARAGSRDQIGKVVLLTAMWAVMYAVYVAIVLNLVSKE